MKTVFDGVYHLHNNLFRKKMLQGLPLLTMCLPALLLLFLFNYLPMGGLVVAFKDFKFDRGIFGSAWNGLNNFKFFFTSQDAWLVLRNTIGMNFAGIIIGTFMAVVFALLLNEVVNRTIVKFYQTVMFFPYFLSWIVVAYMVFSFLDPRYGIFTLLLEKYGIDISWYTEPLYWPFILITVTVWKGLGYGMVLIYAAIMGIDGVYYEAAKIDGASKLQQIFKITIPMIMPIITIITMLSVGRILNSDFGLFYWVTMKQGNGMLVSTTNTIDTYVYRALSGYGDVGMGAAIGFFQSTVGFLLVFTTNLAVRKMNSESALF